MNLKPFAKSLTAALIAGAGAIGTAAADGVITATEWVTVITVTVIAGWSVWRIPWMPAKPAAPLADPPFTRVNP